MERPWLWNLTSGGLEELPVGLPGAVFLEDWYPDGSAVLLRHSHEARDQLVRLELATATVTELTPLDGTISKHGSDPTARSGSGSNEAPTHRGSATSPAARCSRSAAMALRRDDRSKRSGSRTPEAIGSTGG